MRTRFAIALLLTDGAVLICFGLTSLLFVPPSFGESYLSYGRFLYGMLPTFLGLVSVACASWLAIGDRGHLK
jgi:hypothetical protein